MGSPLTWACSCSRGAADSELSGCDRRGRWSRRRGCSSFFFLLLLRCSGFRRVPAAVGPVGGEHRRSPSAWYHRRYSRGLLSFPKCVGSPVLHTSWYECMPCFFLLCRRCTSNILSTAFLVFFMAVMKCKIRLETAGVSAWLEWC